MGRIAAVAPKQGTVERAWFDVCTTSEQIAAAQGVGFYERYKDDPVGFAREVLGFEPWWRQVEVATAVLNHPRITVPAGRAVGKSRLDAWIALWFALTRPNSRVILTAPSYQNVQETLWQEIKLVAREALRTLPIKLAVQASTGGRGENGSQIIGLVADKPENFQGIRAATMLVIVDEASGVREDIYTVIEGNIAGGATLLLTGNPTRSTGTFRDSIRPDSDYHTIRISSLESPNVVSGNEDFKGLATREWVERRKVLWGEDSPHYQIHVLGKVVEGQEGQLFSVVNIEAAKGRWEETTPDGRLVIGVDPAGASGLGDESAFATRRGFKILSLHAKRGLTEEGHLAEIRGLVRVHRGATEETPVVIIDRDGAVGAKVYGHVKAYSDAHPSEFRVVGSRSGEKARKFLTFALARDEMWFNLADMFRQGLAIPTDLMLDRELSEIKADAKLNGRSCVTHKDDIKRVIGRSPDRADALCLACKPFGEWAFQTVADTAPTVNYQNPYVDSRARGIDPYDALSAWR